MGCTLLFSGTTQDAETADQARERQVADLVVTALAGVPEATVTEARHTPGVAAAVGIAPNGIVPLDNVGIGSGYTSLAAQMVDAEGASRALDLDVRSGSLDDLHGATVAIGAERAEGANVAVGDPLKFALGDGTRTRLRMVATYERSLGFGEFVLPRELAAPHATDRLAETVLVRTAPDASLTRVEADLQKLASAHPGVQMTGKAALRSDEAKQRKILVWVNRCSPG